MALPLIRDIIKGIVESQRRHEWFKIEFATPKQEEVIRRFAAEQGFKNLRGFNKYMESRDWDYYDVIKVSCRDE